MCEGSNKSPHVQDVKYWNRSENFVYQISDISFLVDVLSRRETYSDILSSTREKKYSHLPYENVFDVSNIFTTKIKGSEIRIILVVKG